LDNHPAKDQTRIGWKTCLSQEFTTKYLCDALD